MNVERCIPYSKKAHSALFVFIVCFFCSAWAHSLTGRYAGTAFSIALATASAAAKIRASCSTPLTPHRPWPDRESCRRQRAYERADDMAYTKFYVGPKLMLLASHHLNQSLKSIYLFLRQAADIQGSLRYILLQPKQIIAAASI